MIEDPVRLPEMAAEAAGEGFDAIVAAGGDGTVSGVAAGLHACGGRVPLGILPCGTGNDLATHLGVPAPSRALDSARKSLRTGRIGALDLVRCEAPGRAETLATNVIVGGLAGRVAEAVTPASRRRWGRYAYLLAGLAELRRLRSHRIALRADGRRYELDVLMVVVGNSPLSGGGLALAPSADPFDGRLSVVTIPAVPVRRIPGLVARVLRARHEDAEGVLSLSVRRLELQAGPDWWMNRDGETWVAGASSFTILPAALPILLPGNAPIA